MTSLTPLTPRAMVSAVDFSAWFFAKPESMTVPFIVSTLMLAASTSLFSTKRALIWVVMVLSATYAPTRS